MDDGRKLHRDFIERWAEFVRENPGKWKREHTEFIDAQFQKNEDFIKRLLKTKDGKKKVMEPYNVTNVKGYSFLK